MTGDEDGRFALCKLRPTKNLPTKNLPQFEPPDSGRSLHDFYVNVIRAGRPVSEREQVRVARITAAGVGILSIVLASGTGATTNAAALVAGLAFVIASSADLPAILFPLVWEPPNTDRPVPALIGRTVMRH